MKKSCITLVFVALASFVFSQPGQKWAVGGNATAAGDFIGTTNNQPLVFKTNNTTRLIMDASGNMVYNQFSGLGYSGLFSFNGSGQLVGIKFTGITTEVLTGDGSFGNINTLTGWFTSPGVTYTNNSVGIGITTPAQKLEVNGNAIFNGSVSAEQVFVGDVVKSEKSMRINTSLWFKGY
jgi:hypothetical protein